MFVVRWEIVSANVQKPPIPEHVFISFSEKDKETAKKIVYALQCQDIPTWIDYAILPFGDI